MSDSTSENSLKLFKGRFNWYGQVFPDDGKWYYTQAHSEAQAFESFCARLYKVVGTSLFNVRHYFYDSNKYEIREEIKKDEAQQSGNARRS